jgi:hypothetical protein
VGLGKRNPKHQIDSRGLKRDAVRRQKIKRGRYWKTSSDPLSETNGVQSWRSTNATKLNLAKRLPEN